MNTEEIKDTFAIQLASLQAFAKELGYWYCTLDNSFHAEKLWGLKVGIPGCDTISFNRMVAMHNDLWSVATYTERVHNSSSDIKVDPYTYTKAKAARIVQKVHMNGGRKGIKCHKHQVKFVDPIYYCLFLGD